MHSIHMYYINVRNDQETRLRIQSICLCFSSMIILYKTANKELMADFSTIDQPSVYFREYINDIDPRLSEQEVALVFQYSFLSLFSFILVVNFVIKLSFQIRETDMILNFLWLISFSFLKFCFSFVFPKEPNKVILSFELLRTLNAEKYKFILESPNLQHKITNSVFFFSIILL